MLSIEVQSRGLSIINEAALAGVWRASLDGREVSPLFAELWSRGSVVYHLFTLDQISMPSLTHPGSRPIVEHSLTEVVLRLARDYGHAAVNEVHLLVALIELFRDDLAQQFGRLAQAERALPKDSRLDQVLGAWRRSGKSGEADRITASLRRSHLSLTEVTAKLSAYLSSPYYPYNEERLASYRAVGSQSRRAGPVTVPDHTVAFFAAHLARDLGVARRNARPAP